MKQPSKRIIYTTDARLSVKRFAGEGNASKIVTLEGYCMVWNTLSSDRGGYKVRLLPGSATFATPTHALYHHDYTHVLGSTANGTLRITPDDTGVKVEIDVPIESTSGNDAVVLVEGRYVTGMSFAMVTAPEGKETVEGGETILNVSAFTCDEVTITPIPAFMDTTIDVKTVDKVDADFEESESSEENEDDLQLSQNKSEAKKELSFASQKLEEKRLALYRL